MSVFEETAQRVVSIMAQAMGADFQAATYTPPGGAPITCQVIVDEALDNEPVGDLVPIIHQTPECFFLKAEVPSPQPDAILSAGGKDWDIVKQTDDDGHVVRCEIRPA